MQLKLLSSVYTLLEAHSWAEIADRLLPLATANGNKWKEIINALFSEGARLRHRQEVEVTWEEFVINAAEGIHICSEFEASFFIYTL